LVRVRLISAILYIIIIISICTCLLMHHYSHITAGHHEAYVDYTGKCIINAINIDNRIMITGNDGLDTHFQSVRFVAPVVYGLDNKPGCFSQLPIEYMNHRFTNSIQKQYNDFLKSNPAYYISISDSKDLKYVGLSNWRPGLFKSEFDYNKDESNQSIILDWLGLFHDKYNWELCEFNKHDIIHYVPIEIYDSNTIIYCKYKYKYYLICDNDPKSVLSFTWRTPRQNVFYSKYVKRYYLLKTQ
jgi:hypothetical protein